MLQSGLGSCIIVYNNVYTTTAAATISIWTSNYTLILELIV